MQTTKFNEKEAASVLGLGIQTMRNWRFTGKGPAYLKLGRRVVYCLEDLQTYMNKNRIIPDQEGES